MKTLAWWQVFFVMATTLALISWIKQDSLADYWQQSYQSNGVWAQLSGYPAWQQGRSLAVDGKVFTAQLHAVNNQSNQLLNDNFYAETLQKRAQALEFAKEQRRLTEQQRLADAKPKNIEQIILAKEQKVFFMGDSLMQGVAPWVMKSLQNDYGVESINLSKQSTGLSYNTFFDWPKTVEDTLDSDPSIGLLVVFLGPNDPWAVPDPDNKAKVVEFDTPRWQTLYHAKMQRVLDAAHAHGVSVIWVTPPNAKKAKLHAHMIALRRIIADGIDPTQVLLMNGQSLLGDNQDDYFDSLMIGGKPTKVRTADGIHFTTEGQKRVAAAIADKIVVQ